MKIITISKVGYNHPSQANWSYTIWQVSLIDTKQPYHNSITVRETFGGDSRFIKDLADNKIKVSEIRAVPQQPKITGVSKMKDIESREFINEVIEWYKAK